MWLQWLHNGAATFNYKCDEVISFRAIALAQSKPGRRFLLTKLNYTDYYDNTIGAVLEWPIAALRAADSIPAQNK